MIFMNFGQTLPEKPAQIPTDPCEQYYYFWIWGTSQPQQKKVFDIALAQGCEWALAQPSDRPPRLAPPPTGSAPIWPAEAPSNQPAPVLPDLVVQPSQPTVTDELPTYVDTTPGYTTTAQEAPEPPPSKARPWWHYALAGVGIATVAGTVTAFTRRRA